MKIDTAEAGESFWRYKETPPNGTKLLLLTVHGSAVIGNWQGEYGQYYIAWSALPKRNKILERELYCKPSSNP